MWWTVLVWWAIRSGGNRELERHEPKATPMACVFLLRTCPPEHLLEDLGRKARKRSGRPRGPVNPRQGQLSCPARKVHRWGWVRGGQEGNVRQGLHILSGCLPKNWSRWNLLIDRCYGFYFYSGLLIWGMFLEVSLWVIWPWKRSCWNSNWNVFTFLVNFNNFFTSLFAWFVVKTKGHTDLFTIATFSNILQLQAVMLGEIWLSTAGSTETPRKYGPYWISCYCIISTI